MPVCPDCSGRGASVCFVDRYDTVSGETFGALENLPCMTCNGTGRISDDDLAALEKRRELGRARRASRLAAMETAGEAAKRAGMTRAEYTRWERGDDDARI